MADNDQINSPDCANCFLRDSCPNAVPGQFCTKWISREAPKREPDPNDLWRRGEEAMF